MAKGERFLGLNGTQWSAIAVIVAVVFGIVGYAVGTAQINQNKKVAELTVDAISYNGYVYEVLKII